MRSLRRITPDSGDVRISALADALALDARALDDVALAVDQQRELAQRPAIYAGPLAFKRRPQAPAGHERKFAVRKCRCEMSCCRLFPWRKDLIRASTSVGLPLHSSAESVKPEASWFYVARARPARRFLWNRGFTPCHRMGVVPAFLSPLSSADWSRLRCLPVRWSKTATINRFWWRIGKPDRCVLPSTALLKARCDSTIRRP